MIRKTLIIFFMMCGVCLAATISRQNIKPKADYASNGNMFFMVNMICEEENTSLPNVINNMFIRSNVINCLLDGSNTFDKSIYLPEKEIVELNYYEELDARVKQLEKFITDEGLEAVIE